MPTAREEMIDAAERIAVERGLAAMSLREVQAASGQRNKSAAQYHFGSREGLIEAVVTARMAPVNESRLARLADLDATGGSPTVRQLVEVLVEPLAEHTLGTTGSRWARFVAQGLADPAVAAVVQRCFAGRSYREVHGRLVAAVGDLPEPLRARRVAQVVGLVVLTLAEAEGRSPAGRRALPDAAVVADLVDACVGLLTAPPSAATTAELAATRTRRA